MSEERLATIVDGDKTVVVNLDDHDSLLDAVMYKARHIKAHADPEIFIEAAQKIKEGYEASKYLRYLRSSELGETISHMCSCDYVDRFKAEYEQTKIRYERLKAFNNKLEAARRTEYALDKRVEAPEHDCPADLLLDQQRAMGEYLHILEVRAVIEGVEL